MKTIKSIFVLVLTLALGTQAFALNGTGENEIREFRIKGTDNMKFDVTEIKASPGETIKLTLVVESNLPKTAMGHNVAVVQKGINVEDFVMKSMTAKDNEYIAPELEDQVIAATKMIGGGETDTIEFTVPEEPGEYEYVCTFPGHYFGGMKGKIIVG